MFKSSRKEVKYHGPEMRFEVTVEFMVYTGRQELQELLRVVQWMRDFYLPEKARERREIRERLLEEKKPWGSETLADALKYEASWFKIFKKKHYYHDDIMERQLQETLTRQAYDDALHDIQTYRLIHEDLLTAEKMLQHLFYYEDRNHHLQRAILLYRRHA